MAITKKRGVDEVRFEIDQLKKDKVISAVESCAVTLICLFGYFFTSIFVSLLGPLVNNKMTLNILIGINIALAVIAVAFMLVAFIGNMKRRRRIKALEQEL